MLRSVGINGGGFDSRSTHDNMVYQASRLPQSFDASAMPMTHTALHHMRAGLGVEEQMEFIASSGFHCEPGTNAANLGFSKRARFSVHAHHPLGSNLFPVEYNSKIGLG